MCLAVPGKITEINGPSGTVDVEGTQVTARLDFVDDAVVGDFVLVHAGFAISRVDESEANEVLELRREARRLGNRGSGAQP